MKSIKEVMSSLLDIFPVRRTLPQARPDTAQMIADRDEALLSLDRTKIELYMRKYNIPVPEDDRAFWGGVHKAITAVDYYPLQVKVRSHEWLTAHQMMPWDDRVVDRRPDAPSR